MYTINGNIQRREFISYDIFKICNELIKISKQTHV